MTQIIDLGKLRFNFASEWNQATTYELNDVVTYGGNVYVYIYPLRDSGVPPTDESHWAMMVRGFKFLGAYNAAATYRVGESVSYGGDVYVVKAETTGHAPSDANYWIKFVAGVNLLGEYDDAISYAKNDAVTYGGNTYVAQTETLGNAPTDTSKWSLWVSGIRPRGEWIEATQYTINDVVTYGGNAFICLATHPSTSFASDLAAQKWKKFNGGIDWKGQWVAEANYKVNDVVRFNASSYICTADHVSSTAFFDDSDKWEFIAQGADFAVPNPEHVADGLVVTTLGGAFVLADGKPKVAVINSNTNAKDGYSYQVDSSGGSFEIVLPQSPAIGARVCIADGAQMLHAFPVMVLRNGENINSIADDLMLNVGGADIKLTYINSTIGWKVN